jgi:hypothetical protein
MTTQKNCSLVAAAYTLGVDADALEIFVNHHRPLPGRTNPQGETLFKVGDEMALLLDSLNPQIAHRWRIANYLHHRVKPISK